MSRLWDLHADGDCWPSSCRACQYEDDLRADWPKCGECEEATDPEECAPSCAAHTICVSCFEDAEELDCSGCQGARQEMSA